MNILVLGEKIETKEIVEIYDIERDKAMFLNRSAGFVIRFIDGSWRQFGESIGYDSYPHEIMDIKKKWAKLQKEVIDKWESDKHGLEVFGFKPIYKEEE